MRDALLGRLSPDLDFTTDARPEQVQNILRRWADNLWDTGIQFGTVGVGKGDHRLEITTFRADTYDQVSRNPDVQYGDCPRTIWCAATSRPTRWPCASRRRVRANSSIR